MGRQTPPPDPAAPAADPLATTAHPGSWAVALTTTTIELPAPDGTGARAGVRASLGGLGTPEEKPALLERWDRRALRPAVAAYLRGAYYDDDALAPLLPLEVPEALALLRARHPLLAHAVTRCTPVGDHSEREVGAEARPPVSQQTISERKHAGIRILGRWLAPATTQPTAGDQPGSPGPTRG